ncbi:MAG: alpha/beta hydrolase [Thermobacillus sp.]|uniref:alpha/beta hydrolase family protein n=1 Tax=Thermobacillus sp. TaxID=2108467 RepID=UPI000E36FC7C|nr:MFS transporter [Thermobacillus sp.]REK52795.1 MAG: alpha/beta hydrolase [Thermobacillus sp.]
MAETKLSERVMNRTWRKRLMTTVRRLPPLSPGWKGAAIALSGTAGILFLVQSYLLIGSRGPGDYVIGTAVFLLAIALISGGIAGLLHVAKRIPSRYIGPAIASFILLFISFIGPMTVMVIVTLSILAGCSLSGALVCRWMRGAYREAKTLKKTAAGIAAAVTAVMTIGIGTWLVDDGRAKLAKPYRLSVTKPTERYPAVLDNPAEPGPYPVRTLTYGSKDSYRAVFNAEDSLITEPVDGSAFVANWSSLRTKTFGFGPEAMPLNGLVWYPDGDGPFPLVMIVHGNHLATDYSDPGYAYLGELLASRGYIVVSIDENFLNTSPFDDLFMLNVLENENPARGWLMLEHLKVWEEWNGTEGNPFHGKADMSRIALIGHSRGGEAVTVAAAYNRLPASPENGGIAFDYGFGIRSVISLAGTDGQYEPAGRPTELTDLNYLALQGSHDMDVSSFAGAAQYSRIGFTPGSDYFKASVYIYGANHGQFNTVWGRSDAPGLGNLLYNRAQLIPQEEQLQAAKVLISSFLEATLYEKTEYRAIFQDLGHAREWLPDTMYIHDYADSRTTLVSTFDEDIDLTTTTLPGGQLIGEQLAEWKEEKVEMKFAPGPYSAVRLGWDRDRARGTPSYTIVLPDTGLAVPPDGSIVFSVADRSEAREEMTDLTVQVEDVHGNTASMPLSAAGGLLPMLEGGIVKWPLTSLMPTREPVFQTFAFRLSDFGRVNPAFQPERLSRIRLVFDKTAAGSIYLRDVGIRDDVAVSHADE